MSECNLLGKHVACCVTQAQKNLSDQKPWRIKNFSPKGYKSMWKIFRELECWGIQITRIENAEHICVIICLRRKSQLFFFFLTNLTGYCDSNHIQGVIGYYRMLIWCWMIILELFFSRLKKKKKPVAKKLWKYKHL